MSTRQPKIDPPETFSRCGMRWVFFAFGWLNVGLGIVGIVVPGLPTTVFLIIALWAFSRSSERFRWWLWNHPRLGPPLRAWHRHRVISPAAKAAAVLTMATSLVIVVVFVAESWVLPTVMAAVMVPVALYLLTRASSAPATE